MTHPAIGREITASDWLDQRRCAALHATIDADGPAPTDALPRFWHWIYFTEAEPQRALGRDGHPARGGFIPDLGLPRRMWAGGRLEFHNDLALGRAATRRTVIEAITEKAGRTGPLAFVTLRHEIRQADDNSAPIIVTEWQDIVYREDAGGRKPTPPAAPSNEDRARVIRCNSTMLFRYSALTFNGHRIHYDRDYAREVEGYDGLVVHGPLIAQFLLEEASKQMPVAAYKFRAASPAFDFEDITLCQRDSGDGLELWARGPDGRLIMSATATPR